MTRQKECVDTDDPLYITTTEFKLHICHATHTDPTRLRHAATRVQHKILHPMVLVDPDL